MKDERVFVAVCVRIKREVESYDVSNIGIPANVFAFRFLLIICDIF